MECQILFKGKSMTYRQKVHWSLLEVGEFKDICRCVCTGLIFSSLLINKNNLHTYVLGIIYKNDKHK